MELKKPEWLRKFMGHAGTINHHKYLVTKMCFQVGLYRQGICHDLSKYHPMEFLPGVKYYQGTRSPISAEKEEKGMSEGWLHHKGRNPHHFEYWIDYSFGLFSSEEGKKPVPRLAGMKMTKKYVAEMIVDRICASKNYQKENYTDSSALDYYMKGREAMIIHPESDYLARYLLTMLAKKGEAYFIDYMRNRLLVHLNRDYHVIDGRLYLD